jgi:glycosyltransferase involved in cell wall biosynthesis
MLAQFYPPIIGGEEQHVQSLSHELASRGYQVTVATLGRAGLPAVEVQDGVRIQRLHGSAQRLSWLHGDTERPHAPPAPDPELVWQLRDLIQRDRPHIVHAHNWLVHSFLPLKSWAGAPLVLSLHDYSLVCAQKRLMHRNHPCSGPALGKCLACTREHYGPAKGLVTTLSARAMRGVAEKLVDMFLPVSQAVAVGSGLAGSGLPYQVIPNWASETWFASAVADDQEMAQLPAGDFLLFVGDLTYDKGVTTLLNAYRLLRVGNPAAPPLVLVGRRRAETPTELPPGVIEAGCLSHRAVMAAWGRCMAALIPSRWAEPFGMVALEAMAAGKPIIAAASGGLTDIVLDQVTGILTPPGDAAALAGAMGRLVADPPLRRAMGAAGKARLHEYRATAIVGRIEQVYHNLLEAQQMAHGARLAPPEAEQQQC